MQYGRSQGFGGRGEGLDVLTGDVFGDGDKSVARKAGGGGLVVGGGALAEMAILEGGAFREYRPW